MHAKDVIPQLNKSYLMQWAGYRHVRQPSYFYLYLLYQKHYQSGAANDDLHKNAYLFPCP